MFCGMQGVEMFRPPVNRAMNVVDRALFQKDIQISAGRISDIKSTWRVLKEIDKNKALLNIRNIAPVQPDPKFGESNVSKCLLLTPDINHKDKSTWNPTILRLVENGDLSLFPFNLQLGYDNWTAHEILSAILPESLLSDIPTSFSKVGHIIHLNLRAEYLPYKHLIAQVLMDKNPGVRSVINKRDTLGESNVFRVLDYELLLGEDNLLVEVKEDNCIYRFDLSKVFWNVRLGTEHKRLVDIFEEGQAVCDVMAGVGPFTIPAGRKGVFVWANDLNTHCYDSLKAATALNKVSEFVKPFNKDGHSFIKEATSMLLQSNAVAKLPRRQNLTTQTSPEHLFKHINSPKVFSHYIMNLPGSAIEFLPNFIGLYAGKEYLFQPYTDQPLPIIHCYCFGLKNEGEIDAVSAEVQICDWVSEKIEHSLRPSLPGVTVTEVRDVAPKKRQYRISFTLPRAVAFRSNRTI